MAFPFSCQCLRMKLMMKHPRNGMFLLWIVESSNIRTKMTKILVYRNCTNNAIERCNCWFTNHFHTRPSLCLFVQEVEKILNEIQTGKGHTNEHYNTWSKCRTNIILGRIQQKHAACNNIQTYIVLLIYPIFHPETLSWPGFRSWVNPGQKFCPVSRTTLDPGSSAMDSGQGACFANFFAERVVLDLGSGQKWQNYTSVT